ncbi:acyl-CoA synthetase [Marinibaculum pumilum]|uniref:Acyl-CoA synthetase n=1 Tax=Marinibaculum pumilum TaxID=1766165 RepID=A0ABV7L6T6_9PROT
MTETAAEARPRIAGLADIEALEAQPFEQVYPPVSAYDLLRRSAERHGDRVAIAFQPVGDPEVPVRETSYAALLGRVTQAANLFRSLGVDRDSAVALLMPPVPDTHLALWGAETAGRACPINFMLNADHIVELLQAAQAKVLVAYGPDPALPVWEKAQAVAARLPGLAVLQGGTGEGQGSLLAAMAGHRGDALDFPEPGRDDVAACFHTGGTTGAPKLAQHRHGNQVHTAISAAMFYDAGPEDVIVNGFPLFHVAGAFVYGLSMFAVGAKVILPTPLGFRDQAYMRNYWRFVDRERVTLLAAVPTIMATLLGTPVDGADISSARLLATGGSPLPTELAAAFEAQFGLPVRNILGMTECAGVVSIEPVHGPRVPGSAGLRLPFSEVAAVPLGPDGPDMARRCAVGETGVVVLRGPNVSPGYTDPARNAGTFAGDGWLVSGDLGHVDERGYIHVTGRSKDVIIRGGHNIDPAVIEEALAAHPAVEICAAVGRPDTYAGELPVAFVTLKAGQAATEAELLDFLADRIAERPALPKQVTALEAMPLTPVGKIYKPALRLKAIEAVFADLLAPAAAETGAAISVTGQDEGGRLSAVIRLAGGDKAAAQAAIATALRDISVPWRLERTG